jgi:hydrogenase maturation protease
MSSPRILIAGIGNVFLGDDAFGVEVAKRLAKRSLPDGVRVVDFGIRGYDLAYALLDGYDAAILVDASPRGGAPGTLYVIEPNMGEPGDLDAGATPTSGHGLDVVAVFRLVRELGGRIPRVRLVACEPANLGSDCDGQMELSPPVRAAVEPAIELVESLVQELSGCKTEAIRARAWGHTEHS